MSAFEYGTSTVGATTVAVAVTASLASDVFPAGSVAFAVTLPAGISFVGVMVATPFSSALPVPRLLPSLSNNSTVDPGSAFTLTGSLVPALPVKSVSTTGLAGAVVSLVTNSDNGFVSVESSVYVTTRFPLSSFVTDLILPSLSTAVFFAIFASSFFLLYSSCSFSLILSNSASVTLAGSATSTLSARAGVAMSYLSV